MGRQNQVVELVAFMDGPSEVEGRRSRARQAFRCMSPGPAMLDLWLEADLTLPTLPMRQGSLSSHLTGDSRGHWTPSPSIQLCFPIWGAEVCLHDCLDQNLAALRLSYTIILLLPALFGIHSPFVLVTLSWTLSIFCAAQYVLWPIQAYMKTQHSLVGHPYSLGGV